MMMTINGVTLESLFGNRVEFLTYELPQPSFNRYVKVTDNDRKIVQRRESIGINNIAVTVVFYDTKEASYIMASKIASLLGDALVNFGGDITYRVQVATDGSFENLTYNMYKYVFQLQILEKMGDEITVTSTDDAIAVTNDGTYMTPLKIEITPAASGASMALAGFGVHTADYPLTILTITAGQKITVDGDKCLITENVGGNEINKFGSTNLTEFPEIPVGTTVLTFTPAGSTKVITYRPRYV